MASGEHEPLEFPSSEQHPCGGRQHDVHRVDLIAKSSAPGRHEDHVAPADQVDLQERVGVCDAVACYRNGSGLSGEARPSVVARALREDSLCRSLVDGQTCVETWNGQDADPRPHRRLAGGSGMGGDCQCSEEECR
jgi:hypothetical protein